MINHYKLIYLPDVHFLSAEVNTVILNQTFWQILTRNSVWRNTAKCSVFKTAVHFHQFKIIYNFQAERFRKGRCKIVGEEHRWGRKAKDAGTSLHVPKRDGQAQRWTFTSILWQYRTIGRPPILCHRILLRCARYETGWSCKIFGWCLSRPRKLSRDQLDRIRTGHASRTAFVGRIISYTILYSVAKCNLHLSLLI